MRMTWADQTLVGNVYSRDNAVEERGRFRRMDERSCRRRDSRTAAGVAADAAARDRAGC